MSSTKPIAAEQSAGTELDRLCQILQALRAPDGCPWDREQTLATLKPCLLEEAYELLDAMDDDLSAHAEELGDVLLQVVFQASIREEEQAFTLAKVIKQLNDKLVRRHPHVFGNASADTTQEVLRNWEAIKRQERADTPTAQARSALAGVPSALPALLRAQRIQAKAARVGFDWPSQEGPRKKIDEELAEVEQAITSSNSDAIEEEIGDLLFSIVNLCRFHKIDAEAALRRTTAKFTTRFQAIEAELESRGLRFEECTLAELDAIWEKQKARLAPVNGGS